MVIIAFPHHTTTRLFPVHAPTPPADARSSAPIDLRRVRQLFSTPTRIAESAFLRREIAARMQERLALVRLAPHHILDAGCGDGADLPPLQSRFPQAQLLGLDASAAMLAAAQTRQNAAMSSVTRMLSQWMPASMNVGRGMHPGLVGGDFACLPLGSNAVDLVWSNLALHWHPQPDKVFAEWRRVLRVDGLLMFSCFGPDTFKEVRGAFDAVDRDVHVLPFVDMHDFGDMLVEAGFATPVMDMEMITVTYDTVDRLLADVRAWGGNPLASRARGLRGSASWNKISTALEDSRRADGKIPLSFEVIYGHAFRPVSRKTAGGESIIRLDLPRK